MEPYDQISKIKSDIRDKIAQARADAQSHFQEAELSKAHAEHAMSRANGLEEALDRLKAIEFPK